MGNKDKNKDQGDSAAATEGASEKALPAPGMPTTPTGVSAGRGKPEMLP